MTAPADNIHQLLQDYYSHELNLQQFDRLKNQIPAEAQGQFSKSCARKKTPFGTDSIKSARSDQYRQQGDLFDDLCPPVAAGIDADDRRRFLKTGEPITLPLGPDKKRHFQNAQRVLQTAPEAEASEDAVAPLLAAVRGRTGLSGTGRSCLQPA